MLSVDPFVALGSNAAYLETAEGWMGLLAKWRSVTQSLPVDEVLLILNW
jgi:hypothetical protein